jgi:hypothetical protein
MHSLFPKKGRVFDATSLFLIRVRTLVTERDRGAPEIDVVMIAMV